MRSLHCISSVNSKLDADISYGCAGTPGTITCDIRETGNTVSKPRALGYVLLGYVLLGLLSLLSCNTNSGLSAKHPDGGTVASSEPLPPDGGCPEPTSVCGTGNGAHCYALEDDPMNCGACGRVCTPGIACVAGACQQRKCTGTLSFQKIATYPPSLDSSYYRGADMNRDGRLDLLEFGTGLTIWLGHDDGTFVASTSYPTTGTAQTWNLPGYAAVGDFNEDGLADLVVTKPDGSDVQIRPGQPGGGLGGSAGTPLSRLLMGDLDGDGHLDVVFSPDVANSSASRVLIRRGAGNGNLVGPSSYTIPNENTAVEALLDWDGDGTLDILIRGTSGLHILHGNGDGSFAEDQPCAVASANLCVFADLNQDGKLDVVWQPFYSQRLATIFGQGDCNFTPRTDYPLSVQADITGNQLPGFVLGDITGDGLPDILILNSKSTTPLFSGNRDGTFSPQADLLIDTSDWPYVWIADVNDDGRADIVSAGSRGIEVYANTCDVP